MSVHDVTADRATLERPRILVVEDDGPIQRALQELLTSEGYDVLVANDGTQALARLHDGTLFDLIILDLRMPVMDGWTFRTAQRGDSQIADVPVIAMSADSSSVAAAVSADAFMRKPFDAGQLLATIARVISDHERRADETRRAQVDRLASLGRIAAGVGHEINNPLAFVQLNAELARDAIASAKQVVSASAEPSLSPERRAALDQAIRRVDEAFPDLMMGLDRIQRIVGQLQTFSRIPERKSAVRLDVIVDQSVAIARSHLHDRARLVRRYEEDLDVQGSAGELGQVFLNLLVNAAQSIPAGRAEANRVEIRLSREGGYALARISDTGQGIPPDVLPRIFDPFFTTKGAHEGTGLGLAISRRIVADHAGELTITSAPGRGTVCTVKLPLSEPGPGRRAPPEDASRAAPHAQRRARVLVIDDEVMIGRVVAATLPRCEVVAVQSAAQAFERLETDWRFDVVICDLHMPALGGREVRDAIATRWPSLLPRFVIMTGGAVSREADEFLAHGDCKQLFKPFSAAELRALVTDLTAGLDEP